MAKPIYAPAAEGPQWHDYIQNLKPVPGKDPLASFQNWRDPYGVLALLGSTTAPGNRAAGTALPANGYSNTPGPQQGTGAFGLVPGSIGAPDPYTDLAAKLPGLGEGNTAAMSGILPLLRGELPGDVKQQIENEGATFGVRSGMPGSELATNRTLRDLGLTSLQGQSEGLSRLGSLVGSTSQTQTVNPALQTEISATNASNAAAPNPEAQAAYSSALFQRYLNSMKGKKNKGSDAIGSLIGTGLGGAAGGFFGGPAGATAGSGIGGAIGKLIGGFF